MSDCFYIAWRYFPASGLRAKDWGRFENVGERSYCWSSSSYAVNSSRAGFLGAAYLVYMEPLRSDSRSYCFPVRCVQAFAVVTIFIDILEGDKPGIC